MLEVIHICEGVPFVGVTGLSIVSDNFQVHLLEGRQLSGGH